MQVFECQKSIDRPAKLAAVRRTTHHDLRPLFATRCIESGVHIPAVSSCLGHQDCDALRMKPYGDLRDEQSANEAKKVACLAKREQNQPGLAAASVNCNRSVEVM